ncbi:MAG: D-aminopeptidase [Rhodospirillales bacterium]|jgi:D-aminopeptidase
MSGEDITALERAIAALPTAYPGPGGAIAVLRRGEVLARHAWGFANAERRIAFTPRTLFRVCSITKQFACAALLSACPDPEVLAPALRARLPRLEGAMPGVAQLCHNQSGLRDYWATAMLLGAGAEDGFGDAEAARMFAATRSTHFAPGTRYSYCNQNFRLISELLEAHAGRDFAALLRRHVFDPAGMESACLAADTRAMPDGTEGYEGSVAAGFRPAVNRILWTGDAGMGACLDDMIAWERWIDATREEHDALYGRLSAPVAFADGAPASYGFGLDRPREFGHAMTAHSGALRGWRSHRLHLAAARISVVVLFNHMADAQAAAQGVLGALLGRARQAADPALPTPAWTGAYVEPETGLLARVEAAAPGEIRLRFSAGPDRLLLAADGTARSARVALIPDGDTLLLERAAENLRTRLVRLEAAPRAHETAVAELAGTYRCAELDAELAIADAGGVAHGAWSGPLGAGRMEQLAPAGADVWTLPCPRALDFAPPGDWTLAVRRDAGGRVAGLRVGCWLARGLDYARERV